MITKFYGALALLSFIALVGTEGSAKLGSISFGQAVIQGLIAMAGWAGFTYLALKKSPRNGNSKRLKGNISIKR